MGEDLELRPDLASPRVDLAGGVDHGGSDEGAVRGDEGGARVRGLLLGGLFDRVCEVDVAQHGADDPAGGGVGVHLREQRPFPGESLRHRPPRGDRQDRAIALRSDRERLLPILVDDGVGQRSERRDESPLEAFSRADEVLQDTRRAAAVRLQEPRPGRLLDVTAARFQQLEARLLPPLDVFELLDLLGGTASLVFELCPTFGERRGLAVEALDVRLDLLLLGPKGAAPFVDLAKLRFQPITLPFAGGERALQRFDLHPAPYSLLACPPPELVHLAPVLVGVPERGLGFVELTLPRGELPEGALQIRLHAGELGLDGIEPSRSAGLGGEFLPRCAFALEGDPERLLRLGPIRLCRTEAELALRESPRGRGPLIRPIEHLGIEGVQSGTSCFSLGQTMVPAAAPPLAFRQQRPQSSRRQLP